MTAASAGETRCAHRRTVRIRRLNIPPLTNSASCAADRRCDSCSHDARAEISTGEACAQLCFPFGTASRLGKSSARVQLHPLRPPSRLSKRTRGCLRLHSHTACQLAKTCVLCIDLARSRDVHYALLSTACRLRTHGYVRVVCDGRRQPSRRVRPSAPHVLVRDDGVAFADCALDHALPAVARVAAAAGAHDAHDDAEPASAALACACDESCVLASCTVLSSCASMASRMCRGPRATCHCRVPARSASTLSSAARFLSICYHNLARSRFKMRARVLHF